MLTAACFAGTLGSAARVSAWTEAAIKGARIDIEADVEARRLRQVVHLYLRVEGGELRALDLRGFMPALQRAHIRAISIVRTERAPGTERGRVLERYKAGVEQSVGTLSLTFPRGRGLRRGDYAIRFEHEGPAADVLTQSGDLVHLNYVFPPWEHDLFEASVRLKLPPGARPLPGESDLVRVSETWVDGEHFATFAREHVPRETRWAIGATLPARSKHPGQHLSASGSRKEPAASGSEANAQVDQGHRTDPDQASLTRTGNQLGMAADLLIPRLPALVLGLLLSLAFGIYVRWATASARSRRDRVGLSNLNLGGFCLPLWLCAAVASLGAMFGCVLLALGLGWSVLAAACMLALCLAHMPWRNPDTVATWTPLVETRDVFSTVSECAPQRLRQRMRQHLSRGLGLILPWLPGGVIALLLGFWCVPDLQRWIHLPTVLWFAAWLALTPPLLRLGLARAELSASLLREGAEVLAQRLGHIQPEAALDRRAARGATGQVLAVALALRSADRGFALALTLSRGPRTKPRVRLRLEVDPARFGPNLAALRQLLGKPYRRSRGPNDFSHTYRTPIEPETLSALLALLRPNPQDAASPKGLSPKKTPLNAA